MGPWFRRPSGARLTGWDGAVPPVNWRATINGPYGTSCFATLALSISNSIGVSHGRRSRRDRLTMGNLGTDGTFPHSSAIRPNSGGPQRLKPGILRMRCPHDPALKRRATLKRPAGQFFWHGFRILAQSNCRHEATRALPVRAVVPRRGWCGWRRPRSPFGALSALVCSVKAPAFGMTPPGCAGLPALFA